MKRLVPSSGKNWAGNKNVVLEDLSGREQEIAALRNAIRTGQSQLIWGKQDSGKTLLVKTVLAQLAKAQRRNCIYWTGRASRRELIEFLIRELHAAGDPEVGKKLDAAEGTETAVNRWICRQSAARLGGIVVSAAEQNAYSFFFDHLAPVSRAVSQFLKNIIHRTRTSVWLVARGYSGLEAGYGWSLYWSDAQRLRLGPLTDANARRLLESCIQNFQLDTLNLKDFRDEILNLSKNLPGSIVKMCELAANPRYHLGGRPKTKVIHVDYLLQANQFSPPNLARHTA